MTDQVIGNIKKSLDTRLQVQVREYKGATFVDCRSFKLGDDGEWDPTKAGVTVGPSKIGDLIGLLQAAQASLEVRLAQHPGKGADDRQEQLRRLRKAACEHHPDRGGNPENFQEAWSAYKQERSQHR